MSGRSGSLDLYLGNSYLDEYCVVGKHLHLYYHEENDAWAIAIELGSLDVLAYVQGDIFDKSYSLAEPTWHLSNGEGERLGPLTQSLPII